MLDSFLVPNNAAMTDHNAPHDLPANPQRRRLLQSGGSLAFLLNLPLPLQAASGNAQVKAPAIGFTPIAAAVADGVRVPAGYQVQVVHAWGDPVSDGPAFRADASNSAQEQQQQVGMHHDGMHFFPLTEGGKPNPAHGLLAVNHEYTDDGLLHSDGMKTWSAEKVAKAQAAVGVSVTEIRQRQGQWQVLRPSAFGRRITAATPCRFSGPAAGHARLRTAADPEGRVVLGTLANCAHGYTPWGTYLTCEENFHNYFGSSAAFTPDGDQKRYGIDAKGGGYRWHEHDPRFDAGLHPNEANRFGWVVEIDPHDPQAAPVKRTALGRFKHENALVTVTPVGRVVVYMGDDERFEYLYKFVSKGLFKKGKGHDDANRQLLDEGTLYVARLDSDGKGEWIALEHGRNGLSREAGFADQGDILIRTRQAADKVGATKMDRPEWITAHPVSGEVYCSLTNNSKRGAPDNPVAYGPNPRANNLFGHILRWQEKGDAAGEQFTWDVFAQAGNPDLADPNLRGDVNGDAFGSPDGLVFDKDGRLWIATDVSTSVLNRGEYAGMGNNQLLCADPVSKTVKRFLTGPMGCEITGIAFSPDSRTLFLNIQHPGETASERSNPDAPQAVSAWPDGPGGGRPRSATLAIRREDSGVIGT